MRVSWTQLFHSHGHYLSLFMSIILLLLVIQPNRGHSFKSLQHLEGTHKGQTVKGLHEIKHYLSAFGYLKLNHSIGLSNDHASVKDKDEFDEHLERAIKSFQKNFHLNVTGRLDSSTLDNMMTPRCGVTDDNMSPNYAFFDGKPKWNKNYLNYTFDSSVTLEVLIRAGECLQLTGDFFGIIRDDQAFDGPGNVLAHAAPPTIGKMHFDADENWSIDNPNGDQLDLVSVATHEIGHILGLQHSTNVDAIMYPFMNRGMTKRELTDDDIDGIAALYVPARKT
ncbi:metalloendoproteinase 5-MMP-like [Castanea sativa]|uniref:metalloendoproteinase 5-MMP-like n=1 Tax=Castanea sativa TaxID=21020 RepID=UPI003F64BB63